MYKDKKTEEPWKTGNTYLLKVGRYFPKAEELSFKSKYLIFLKGQIPL
jgi:hypothetical protein